MRIKFISSKRTLCVILQISSLTKSKIAKNVTTISNFVLIFVIKDLKLSLLFASKLSKIIFFEFLILSALY